MYITTGILNKDVSLIPEKNELFWIPIKFDIMFLNSYGLGNCYVYLHEAIKLLGI